MQARPAPPQVQPVTAPPVVAAVTVRPAPPATTAAPQIGSAGTRAATIQEQYEARIQAWVARYKRYPARAKIRNIEGEVWLRLVIGSDGTVLSAEVRKGSGSSILDEGALGMVERAGKAPSIPDELNRETFLVDLPIPFRLN